MSKVLATLSVFVTAGLVACNGTLYTVRNPTIADKTPVEGLIVYQPKPLIVQYRTTQLVDKDGKLIGSEQKDCSPVFSEEVSELPDYSIPYLVYYDPGFLETGKYSFTLDKSGVLTAANVEHTPATQQAIDFLKTGADIAKGFAAAGAHPGALPACNAGKVIAGKREL